VGFAVSSSGVSGLAHKQLGGAGRSRANPNGATSILENHRICDLMLIGELRDETGYPLAENSGDHVGLGPSRTNEKRADNQRANHDHRANHYAFHPTPPIFSCG
jgi:hypothetical protein